MTKEWFHKKAPLEHKSQGIQCTISVKKNKGTGEISVTLLGGSFRALNRLSSSDNSTNHTNGSRRTLQY